MSVPLTPSSEEARDWASEELSRGVYSEDPTLWELIWGWFWDFIEKILGQGQGLQSIVIPLVLASAIIALIIIALLFGRNLRRDPRKRPTGAGRLWDDDDERHAVTIRRAAHEAARGGDFSLAVIETYRALVRSAEERDIAATGTGTTALEAAGTLSGPYPTHREDLIRAATLFNGALYGSEQCTQADFFAVTALDEALLKAPVHLEVAP